MAIDPVPPVSRWPTPSGFRNAHIYASEVVVSVLSDAVQARELAIVVDVDTLERSALARIDRVMMLALEALARANVEVVFVARYETERASLLQRGIAGSSTLDKDDGAVLTRLRDRRPDVRVIAISDDPYLIATLTATDRALVLGRPELSRANIAVIGQPAVRATLWWLLESRARTSQAGM